MACKACGPMEHPQGSLIPAQVLSLVPEDPALDPITLAAPQGQSLLREPSWVLPAAPALLRVPSSPSPST